MKRYTFFTVAILMAVVASAQDFNPLIEVTNDFETKALDVHKYELPMAVPDSLQVFDYNFDYSVFDHPYKGAYEFSPYMLVMKPQQRDLTGKQFFLSAGAGFTLHPEADIVFNPATKGRVQLGIYDSFRGYMGNYCFTRAHERSESDYVLDRSNFSTVFGYDMVNRLGVNARVNGNSAIFTVGLGYDIIAGRDSLQNRLYNSISINAGVKSRPTREREAFYDVDMKVHYGQDNGNLVRGFWVLTDVNTDLSGSFGFPIARRSYAVLDVGIDAAFYSQTIESFVAAIYALPKYAFRSDRLDASVGVKISTLVSKDRSSGTYQMHARQSKLLYPDIHASLELVRDKFYAYGQVTGGDDINSYYSIVSSNHFFKTDAARQRGPLMDNTNERLNARAGLRGTIASRLQYDLHAGYAIVENGRREGLVLYDNMFLMTNMVETFNCYCDYRMTHVGADMEWMSDRLDIRGGAAFTKMSLAEASPVLNPASVVAALSAAYNWNDRLYFGVNAEYSSARKGAVRNLFAGGLSPIEIPSYLDLGFRAEFRFSNAIGLWIKGGNILNQCIHRVVGFTEKGVSITAGISLNL